MSSWSEPPPLPIFVAINVLAGALRAAADALTPPPVRMLDLQAGFQVSQLAYICQLYELPDLVATGPKSPAEVAAVLTVPVARVERLLYAMAAHGLFKLVDEGGTAKFVNSPLSAVLRKDHPNSMRGIVGHFMEDMYPAWAELPQAFHPDTMDRIPWDAAWPEYPIVGGKGRKGGKGGTGIWAKFEDRPASEEQFGRAMSSLDGLGAAAMAADAPWSKFARVVDVGGSRGHFLHVLLAKYPALEGVLFDRAPVVANARPLWDAGGAYFPGEGRAALVVGDFFAPGSLPRARDGDAFLLRYILHDWQDAAVASLLRNLREAIGDAKATLMIGEMAIPDRDAVGPVPAMYAIDLQMMVAFGYEAKERTPTQWRADLGAAGFDVKAIHATRSLLHWVEATPI